jgi:hypothetical protein
MEMLDAVALGRATGRIAMGIVFIMLIIYFIRKLNGKK